MSESPFTFGFDLHIIWRNGNDLFKFNPKAFISNKQASLPLTLYFFEFVMIESYKHGRLEIQSIRRHQLNLKYVTTLLGRVSTKIRNRIFLKNLATIKLINAY